MIISIYLVKYLKEMKEKTLKIFAQLLYWLFQLGAILFFININIEREVSYSVTWVVVTFPFKLIFFYSFFYYFIPRWLNNKSLRFALVSVGLIILYPLLKMQIDSWVGIESLDALLIGIESDSSLNFWLEFIRRALTVLLNMASAFIARFTVDWFRNRELASQMEKNKLQSELSLLRSQVNPHFLFNTLNNIDSLVYKVSEEASEAIMKLSAIMRYMLYESATPYVQITKEVDYLHSYFDLERMRVKYKQNIKLDTRLENPMVQIAPMMFIPFIENAFKHATHTPEGIKVIGKIEESDGVVELTVINSFDATMNKHKDETGGIGLQNVKRRLELIYPDRHSLSVNLDNDEYLLNLKIDLNDH